MRNPFRFAAVPLLAVTLLALACSSSSNGGSTNAGDGGAADGALDTHTGQSCTDVSQCYPGFLDAGVDASAIQGATCLTQLTGGYCTHTCSTDADCCAVPGECPDHFKEVCASFESSGQTYCFLSCDAADLAADPDAGTTDATVFCQTWASSSFTCRSTGGGAQQRKFCGP